MKWLQNLWTPKPAVDVPSSSQTIEKPTEVKPLTAPDQEEATKALRDIENALRDLIAGVLSAEVGSDWVSQCGASEERIRKWKERKEEEEKRLKGSAIEQKLIYYADFYDLRPILKKHWDKFSPSLGEFKRIDVFLEELERLRVPDAHRRQLLPHQIQLALGISGELRAGILRYRSKHEKYEDSFPRIEGIADNLGNITDGTRVFGVLRKTSDAQVAVRPGDQVVFTIKAVDPEGQPLLYGIRILGRGLATQWQQSNVLTWDVITEDIAKDRWVELFIRSHRQFHAHEDIDDEVAIRYAVLPPKP